MGKLSIGQIVLSSFPFSDLTHQKVRPCLIIGLAEFGDIIVCQITSKRYRSRKAIQLSNNDFKSGSIVITSFIRPDKIATLDRTIIIKTLGVLNSQKLFEIKAAIKKVLEIR